MPRPSCAERAHFVQLEHEERSQGGYKFFACKHCTRAYNTDQSSATDHHAVPPPKKILGRSYAFKAHLAICQHYSAEIESVRLGQPVVTEGNDSSERSTANRSRVPVARLFASPSRRSSTWRSPKSSSKRKSPRRLSKNDKRQLERLLVEFQADNRLSDVFIERGSTKRLFDFLLPGVSAHLPSRRVLGGRILTDHAAHCSKLEIELLKKVQAATRGRVNCLSDVWMNVSKDHLLGCQLSLFGQTLTYALPSAGARHDGLAIAEQLEQIMERAYAEHWDVGAIVTDNAGQCGRARRILARRWPSVAFTFCFAHDINNLVKAVLKSSFRQIATDATAAVQCLNASSSKWLLRARGLMESFYGYHLGLFTLCETRWNSMQFCFASLLRVRSALQMLARKYKHTSEFPSALLALDQSSFWDDLAKAERVIEPLAIASFRLQRDENTVADVVISYRDIFRGFQAINGSSSTLLACVEARWAQCEQPLFMLGYALHPSHIGDARQLASTGTVVSSRSQLCKFAVYYYRRFIGEDFGSIRSEMRQWLTGEMTSALAVEFPNSVEFWHYVEDEHPRSKLPDLALKVLSIAVNTATCERLFSELSLIHTAKRNRMTSTKAHDTHVICKHIRQRDQKATSELLIRTLPSQEREIGGAGLRMQRSLVMPESDADSQQRLLRFTSPSPRAGRPRLPPTAPCDDEALDDIGDGVNGEDTFLLWDEYLEEVFDDDEVADVYAESSLYHDDPEDETELAPIPRPDRTPFPARNEPNFPQERALGGIRAHKVSLADLFA